MEQKFFDIFTKLYPNVEIIESAKVLSNKRYSFDFFLPLLNVGIEIIKPELFVLNFQTRLIEINLCQCEGRKIVLLTESNVTPEYIESLFSQLM